MLEYRSGRIAAKLNKGEKLITKGLDFSVEKGRTLALMGRTGAGKTTVALSIMGLTAENIVLYGNEVVLDGKKLLPEERRRSLGRDIVYIPQSGHECLNKTRKISGQFADSLSGKLKDGRSAAKAYIREETEMALSLAGFEDPEKIMDMYPFELSGGMAQRVVIALAACTHPKLVIADEPTNGIDESFRDEFIPLVKKAFPDAAVIIITHDSELAGKCDSTVRLEEKDVNNIPGELQEKCGENALSDAECRKKNLSDAEYGKNVLSEYGEPLLRVCGVSKSFGNRDVLKCADLEIKKGEFAGLLGKSGIGKSTLAKLITGLEAPDGGEITFDGKSLFNEKGEYDRKTGLAIQMVYQQPYAVLDPSQIIRAGLAELIRYHRIEYRHEYGTPDKNQEAAPDKNQEAKSGKDLKKSSEEECRECLSLNAYIDAAAAKAGLTGDILNHLPGQLSGGEAQRVAILKCLLMKPGLLILDEATSMLDEATQKSILSLIKREMNKNGGSVLMISHDESLTKEYCDSIFVIDDGCINSLHRIE